MEKKQSTGINELPFVYNFNKNLVLKHRWLVVFILMKTHELYVYAEEKPSFAPLKKRHHRRKRLRKNNEDGWKRLHRTKIENAEKNIESENFIHCIKDNSKREKPQQEKLKKTYEVENRRENGRTKKKQDICFYQPSSQNQSTCSSSC